MKSRTHFCFIIIFFLLIRSSFASDYSEILNFNKKSEKLRTIDSKKAIAYSLKAVNLANSGTDISLKALSYKNLGIAFYYHSAFNEALSSYQKALDFYSLIKDSMGISACYNNTALIYKDLNDLNKAMVFYTKALTIDKRMDDKQNLAITYNNIGEIYHLQYKYVLALQFYMLSLHYENNLKNMDGTADCYLNIGAVMEENNIFEKAQFYYEKALSIYRRTSNQFRIGQCYNNLGLVFTRINDFYKAKDCFNMSLLIKDSINDNQGKVTTLLNLGSLNVLMNDSAKAKECFIKAIYWGNSEAFAGMLKTEKNNLNYFQNADDYFFYWISYRIQEGNYFEIPQSLFYKGYVHFNLGEYSKAVGYFVNSLEIAESLSILTIKKDNYLYLSKSYVKLEDYKNASFYAQQYISLSDSINASMISDFIQFKSSTAVDINVNTNFKTDIENPKNILKDIWFISTLFLSTLLLIMLVMFIKKK